MNEQDRMEKVLKNMEVLVKEYKKLEEKYNKLKEVRGVLREDPDKKCHMEWEYLDEKVVGTYGQVKIEKPKVYLGDGRGLVTHTILEGDNYHAIEMLKKTHKGKIDVVYMNPDTVLSNEFKYEGNYIGKSNKRGKDYWMTHIYNRLGGIYDLLSEDGIFIITAGDNYLGELRIILDKLFKDGTFMGTIIRKRVTNGGHFKYIKYGHEYVIMYSKKKEFTGDLRNIKTGETFYSIQDDREYLARHSHKYIGNILPGKEIREYTPKEFLELVLGSLPITRDFKVLDMYGRGGELGDAVLHLNENYDRKIQFITCTDNRVSERDMLNFFYNRGIIDYKTKSEFNKVYKDKSNKIDDMMEADEYKELGEGRGIIYKRLTKIIRGYIGENGKKYKPIPAHLQYIVLSNKHKQLGELETKQNKLRELYVRYPANRYTIIWEEDIGVIPVHKVETNGLVVITESKTVKMEERIKEIYKTKEVYLEGVN